MWHSDITWLSSCGDGDLWGVVGRGFLPGVTGLASKALRNLAGLEGLRDTHFLPSLYMEGRGCGTQRPREGELGAPMVAPSAA